MKKRSVIIVTISIVALLVIGGFVVLRGLMSKEVTVNSFEECVAAGNPVRESYPEVCATKDGQSFPNQTQVNTVPQMLTP